MLSVLLKGESLIAFAIFFPMAMAVIAGLLLRKTNRACYVFVSIATVLTLLACLALAIWKPNADLRISRFGSLELSFEPDGFRAGFGCIAGFLWVVTTLFSQKYFQNSRNMSRYWFFNLLTFGAVIGLFFSADFFTAFVFFEMLSLTSYPLVAHDESATAMRAAETYLAVAIVGGLSLLLGIILLNQRIGSLEFSKLYEICSVMEDKSILYLPGALMIVGFGAKAGIFPLHIWLPKAHPAAPAPASALLSGILIKTGVFGVAAVSSFLFPHDMAWSGALMILATVTMLLGAVLGVLSNDLKRTLACSSVSQIGFMIIGISMQGFLGYHNGIAVSGTVLHMINHSLIKLVLFLTAGVVYMNMHELNLDRIRGYGRGKPLLAIIFGMGALSLAGIPFFSGFVSKTLLHESILESVNLVAKANLSNMLLILNMAFVFTGGLTIAYMLRLFVTIFVEKGNGCDAASKKRYVGRLSACVLTASSALLLAFGCFPMILDALADKWQPFFHGHPQEHAIHYFTWENIEGVVYSAVIGVAVYSFVIRRLLIRKDEDGGKAAIELLPLWLDIEVLVYRPVFRSIVGFASSAMNHVASVPDKFLSLFFRRSVPAKEGEVHADRFSIGLILAGAGVCVTLLYVLFQAL